MTKREAMRQAHQETTLLSLGFTSQEAEQLRRISMTLHRWYELECGDSNDYGSWAIERDEDTEKPYMVRHHYAHGNGRDSVSKTPIADREKGAQKRLAAIIAARNARTVRPINAGYYGVETAYAPLSYYLQTDPRGASLYIIRPEDVPEGKNVESYYNRGICVY